MAVGIGITDFANELNRQLRMYANHTDETMDEVAKQVAKDGVKRLKATSPRSPKGGDYAKGWAVKKVKGKYVVHNKKHYRLTHLLEKGHATVDGGRTRKFVHIKPTEDEMIAEFENGLRRGLS